MSIYSPILTSRTSSLAFNLFIFPKSTTTTTTFSSAAPPLLRRHVRPISSIASNPTKSSQKMSTLAPPTSATQFVEHIVLFKIKPETEQSTINSMLSHLNNLTSLDTVLHLTAGAVLRFRHSSAALSFTHLLHSRYLTKADYASYSSHPAHVSVVADYVRPIAADVMAVDWVAEDAEGEVKLAPGAALRVTFGKVKEGLGEEEKGRVLEVIGGIKDNFSGVEQLTFGENFSMERGKGFSIGSIAVFKGVGELEALGDEAERVNVEKDKVRDLLEEVMVVDYVVPPSQSASL